MDEYSARIALVKKARTLMQGVEASCWGEVYEKLATEIASLARQIRKPSAYVFACLVDDVEADIDTDEEVNEDDIQAANQVDRDQE